MIYRAVSKNVKVSPRKVRLVADSICDLTIAKATIQLLVSPKRGAVSLKKTLDSAVANAINNNNAKKEDLKIKTINITEGIRYKRYHFAGRGRTRPYLKRTSHINVILEDGVVGKMPKMVTNATPKVIEGNIVEKKNTSMNTKKGDSKK